MPINIDMLRKYVNKSNIFIETGTHTGTTVSNANMLGFSEIYSIELSDKWYLYNINKFAGFNHINIIHGNSSVKLQELLSTIDKPCVIWLDAHYSGGETAKSICPTYDELLAIEWHHIKTHTIMIDDMRDLDRLRITNAIKKINPNYIIKFEDWHGDNKIFKEDILIATID
jgi:hypothetical protein